MDLDGNGSRENLGGFERGKNHNQNILYKNNIFSIKNR